MILSRLLFSKMYQPAYRAEVVYKNKSRCPLSPLSFNHPHNSRYDCILIYILFWVKVLLHIWNWACNLILLIMILDYFKDKPSLLEVCLPSYTCLLPNPSRGSHFSEISEIPNCVVDSTKCSEMPHEYWHLSASWWYILANLKHKNIQEKSF